eukprot:superscaffoldBa00010232_g24597
MTPLGLRQRRSQRLRRRDWSGTYSSRSSGLRVNLCRLSGPVGLGTTEEQNQSGPPIVTSLRFTEMKIPVSASLVEIRWSRPFPLVSRWSEVLVRVRPVHHQSYCSAPL